MSYEPYPTTPWVAWRQRRDLTQAQLAAIVGVDQSTITYIERARRSPSVAILNRLCDALDLSAEERLEAMRAAERPAEA